MIEWIIAFIVFIALIIVISAIRVVREYEKGVIFRLGRLVGAKGPGLFFVWPMIDRMVKVDLRIVTMDVQEQEVITTDNVTVRVDAIVYYKVVDPANAVVKVERFHIATSQRASTTLRAVIGKSQLDDLLSQRDKLNKQIQQILDEATDPWGIKVTAVEIRNVTIPEKMQRAIAAQAEAERNRRARVISAQGEKQAAEKLSEAADVMAKSKGAMYIRTLQTVAEACEEKASTVVLPLPMEMLEALSAVGKLGKKETKK
jgi:regulator of protease activity HflC (stomatin/prohibitin superfamily)